MRLVYATTDILGLHPVFGPALHNLDDMWRDIVGHQLHVLHGLDGEHSRFSRHYQGCAVDIRTWQNPADDSSGQIEGVERDALLSEVRKLLGKNFWILDHGTHFHVAFKPEHKAWTS